MNLPNFSLDCLVKTLLISLKIELLLSKHCVYGWSFGIHFDIHIVCTMSKFYVPYCFFVNFRISEENIVIRVTCVSASHWNSIVIACVVHERLQLKIQMNLI